MIHFMCVCKKSCSVSCVKLEAKLRIVSVFLELIYIFTIYAQ